MSSRKTRSSIRAVRRSASGISTSSSSSSSSSSAFNLSTPVRKKRRLHSSSSSARTAPTISRRARAQEEEEDVVEDAEEDELLMNDYNEEQEEEEEEEEEEETLSSSASSYTVQEYSNDQSKPTTLTYSSSSPQSGFQYSSSSSSSLVDLLLLLPPHLLSSFTTIFLPLNYPSSVHQDYLSYQIFDTIQGLSSYLRGLLCTASLLKGAGVGSSSATVLGATLNWLIKDGVGLVASLSFGYFSSSALDQHVKSFRLFADLMNDLGLFLELISSSFNSSSMFLFLISCAQVCKAMCGVAASATRATILQHFARSNNVADLATKEGMQETAVTLMGMILGYAIMNALGAEVEEEIDGRRAEEEQSLFFFSQQMTIWFIFTVLTIVHIIANVLAMRSLVFDSLDANRSRSLMEYFIETREILTPQELSDKQGLFNSSVFSSSSFSSSPFYSPAAQEFSRIRVVLGAKLSQVNAENFISCLEQESITTNEFVFVPSLHVPRRVDVIFTSPVVNDRTVALALFHALLYEYKLFNRGYKMKIPPQAKNEEEEKGEEAEDQDQQAILMQVLFEAAPMFDLFEASLKENQWRHSFQMQKPSYYYRIQDIHED